MKISVCILAWNTRITTLEAINILRKDLKDISHEFIIVDNGSDDGLCKDDIENMTMKYVYFKYPSNSGISFGKNRCIDLAAGDFILLLDGDVVPVPNSVNCLLEWMESHKDCHALGFLPNKWTKCRNKHGQKHHEDYCNELYDVHQHPGACLYYGLYRRTIFDAGLRMSTEGVFGLEGYGWEDHDFFEKMKQMGVKQYSCAINHIAGRYYHEINSSVRNMGREKYMETSRARAELFKRKWEPNRAVR